MKRIVGASLVAAALVAVAPQAEAKDLTGRVGVGYQNTLPGTNSAISARYWLNQQIGLQGDLGFLQIEPDQGDGITNFGIGLGGMFAFIHEPNLHVYAAGGLSFGSVTSAAPPPATGTDSNTALGLNLGLGTEFFFVGTPNLGFSTQFGLSFESISDVSNTIALGGGDFAVFGIRYYFGGPKGPGG